MAEQKAPTSEQVALLMSQVFALVKACPPGRVTTYSWIAKALGYPRGARMIGWIMNESLADVPAQRVLNSKGELTGSWAFGQPEKMHQLLEAEGITFLDDGRVELKRYGWDPLQDLSETTRQHVLASASNRVITPSPRLLNLFASDPASPFKIS